MRRSITDFEEWHAGVSDFYDSKLMEPHKPFWAECAVHLNGPLILTDSLSPAVQFNRDPALIRHLDSEYLLFQRFSSGHERGMVGDTPTFIDQGNIHLVDMSRRYTSVVTEANVQAVIVPHHVVGFEAYRDEPYLSFSLASRQGRLIGFAHSALVEAVNRKASDADVLNSAFCAILRAALSTRRGEKCPAISNGDRVALIRAFIDENLTNQGLSVPHICAEFGISRSVLYRLFESKGGIARYIVYRRLDKCLADLAGMPEKRGQVRLVSERWGFDNAANFARSFRERFGVRPSDCMGMGANVNHGLGPDRTPLQEWMRRG